MSKIYKILILVLIAVLVILTYMEASEGEELNWTPSYTASDKIPLGTYALFESLREQDFPMHKIQRPPYEFLKQSAPPAGTYLFINDQLSFEESELQELLQWVEKGNTAFLVAESFSSNLLDTLGLERKVSPIGNDFSSRPLFNLTDPNLKEAVPFMFDQDFPNFYFSRQDSLQHSILGVTQLYQDTLSIHAPEVNFIKDSVGQGVLFLHSAPKAFSNYFLMDNENYRYAEKALGYLPKNQPLFWDAYYKTGKARQSSPLYILFQYPNLKWAYYFVLGGALLFILFEGKRKQRSIPVISPLKNQSINFARTLSGLYQRQRDYTGITSKKIQLFLDYIRRTYRIPTDSMNIRFYEKLGGLSGNDPRQVRELWELMQSLQEKSVIEKHDLLELHNKINAFKKSKHGK